jgi:hypothetical protein
MMQDENAFPWWGGGGEEKQNIADECSNCGKLPHFHRYQPAKAPTKKCGQRCWHNLAHWNDPYNVQNTSKYIYLSNYLTRSTAFRRPWVFCDQRGVMDHV